MKKRVKYRKLKENELIEVEQTAFKDSNNNVHIVYMLVDRYGDVIDADIHQHVYEQGECIYCGAIEYNSPLYKELYGCD